MPWETAKTRLLEKLQTEIKDRLDSQSDEVCLLAKQYFENLSPEDLHNRQLADLYGFIVGAWNFIQVYSESIAKVRVFNPEYKKHGWHLGHTVVAILSKDMPFITDSVRGELNRRNIKIHTINSVVLPIVRDKSHLLSLLDERSSNNSAYRDEALLYIEINRHSSKQDLDNITAAIESVIVDVSIAVSDFPSMLKQCEIALNEISNTAIQEKTLREANYQFMEWLHDGKFTFLGYEEIMVDYEGKAPACRRIDGSELGLLKLRKSYGEEDLLKELTQAESNSSLLENQILFMKSSVRSRVHRLVYPDYVCIKRFDDEGNITGEYRFLGLFTSRVYTLTPSAIPLIQTKVNSVLERSGLNLNSHIGKDLARLLEVFPRDELFHSSIDELYKTAIAVNRIQERRQVRLFVRPDPFGKFVNCLVFVPRDIYRTELRKKVEDLLCQVFGAQESEFTTFFSESILTRTHFVLKVDPKNPVIVDPKLLEEEVVNVTMSWQDHLHNYLVEEFGEEEGSSLIQAYGEAFDPGYIDDFEPRNAIDDIRKIDLLEAGKNSIEMSFYRMMGEDNNAIRFRLYHMNDPISLSDVMPILENLGLTVLSQHPYDIRRNDGVTIWIHEYSLVFNAVTSSEIDNSSEIFQEAFLRVWSGDAENDVFNKLTLAAQLGWRQVAMLRAYANYMKQIQFGFSTDYIAESLCKNAAITKKIVDFFYARFELSDKSKESCDESTYKKNIIEDLEQVNNLAEDRIIRHFLAVINATLRTNYFQKADGTSFKNYFSFKLSPHSIPEIPLPIPMYEIYVYSPRIEGVHLRGGKVARGGLRWSDRIEDFRTEVLGLVKAQQVKNAVIVPTGAKGGFIAKQLPEDNRSDAFREEGIECYKIFIQALLDVTDNLVDGEVVPPIDVLRKDDDDTYLVVAADKGTATFSDIANQLSINANFWLGDAFASGGSAGYDHKKMGITAKGAWVSVQRHFRELGINTQTTDFTIVGCGDMSGDVFGNGMLLSKHIQLIAAFNHLNIFIDPNPDSAKSFAERQRLFELPRSSWSDYDKTLISKGGGVFSRSAKSITISDEMKQCFDINADSLTPNELIKYILKSSADLFWNGGIGTYFKASHESHADVGDKANDVLRVDANQMRFKVIGEGGNLGVTQLARVEYALHGGRSNTDFIDNAGGVDCSDHEVNIKILLNGIVANGDMTEKQRNALLEDMTDSVAELVLDNNYSQTQALSLAEREAVIRIPEYRRLINHLESKGKLNRALEFIPTDEILLERKAAGKSLTRPELSILMSYVKSQLKGDLVDSTVTDDPYMLNSVESAFPLKLRKEFNQAIHSHRLRREIIATQLANDLVNHMGITFVNRLMQSTGVSASDVVRAYVAARDVFDMHTLWSQIEELDYRVTSSVQMELMIELMRLIRHGTRWFIRNRRLLVEPAQEIEKFKEKIVELREVIPTIIRGDVKEHRSLRCQAFIDHNVPESLASDIASANELYPFLGIIEAANELDVSVDKTAELFFGLFERLELDWFAKEIATLKTDNHWQALARESYRDDLDWQIRALTMGAMRHMEEDGDVDACIDRWMEQQKTLVDRWRIMISDLQSTDVQELAMFSVAIRELLDMAQSSKYGDIQ